MCSKVGTQGIMVHGCCIAFLSFVCMCACACVSVFTSSGCDKWPHSIIQGKNTVASGPSSEFQLIALSCWLFIWVKRKDGGSRAQLRGSKDLGVLG